jgi:hypothetical protein
VTENVVSLRGDKVQNPGTPNAEVIEDIERLLEAARSGEINAIAYAVRYKDDLTSYRWVGIISRAMVGAIELAKLGMCQQEISEALGTEQP